MGGNVQTGSREEATGAPGRRTGDRASLGEGAEAVPRRGGRLSTTHLRLLGCPDIEHEGRTLELPRRKSLALLAYLAVTGVPHRRESLLALLWPDAPPPTGLAYLRNALWILRTSPLDRWLEVTPQTIVLRPDSGLFVDTIRFRACVRAAGGERAAGGLVAANLVPTLAEAVEMYRGPFLDGLRLGGREAFDEWRDVQETGFRRDCATLLELLVRHHAARRRPAPAIAYARRWLALDPLDERVIRHLMYLLARAGQRSEARQVFREGARHLRRQLGLPPEDETVRLDRRIHAQEVAPVRPAEDSAADRIRLPSPATPFFGRQDELARVRDVLTRPEGRLVTIVGLGGSGKTRLAVTAGAELAGAFDDGVCFVPLASVESARLLPSAILDALGAASHTTTSPETPARDAPLGKAGGRLKDTSGRSSPTPGSPSAAPDSRQVATLFEQRLARYLRPRSLLLVLDNFEHLVAGRAMVARLLESAPGVRALVTSRERLGLRGEHVLELEGLAWPPESVAAEDGAHFPSVAFLIDAAQRVGAERPTDPGSLQAAAQVCRFVQGMPLAIEIAASWLRALSFTDLAREVARGSDVLTSTGEDLPARHRSLRAIFDATIGSLAPEARLAFGRLSVFSGPFRPEAAAEVAGCLPPILAALVDRALLRRDPSGLIELPDLLRQYAAEMIDRPPRERRSLIERHRRHYLHRLAGLELPLRREGQIDRLRELLPESANLRAAWSRTLGLRRFDEIECAATACFLFHDILSRFAEGADMFREAASALEPPAGAAPGARGRRREKAAPVGVADLPGLHAWLLAMHGWFLRQADQRAGEQILASSILQLDRGDRGHRYALAAVLWSNGTDTSRRPNPVERLERACTIYHAAGERWAESLARDALAWALCSQDPKESEQEARRSLAGFRRCADTWGVSLALFSIGRAIESQGRFAEAQAFYEESLATRRAVGTEFDPEGALLCLLSLGQLASRSGSHRDATERYAEALRLAGRTGNRLHACHATAGLALTAWQAGDPTAARQLALEAAVLQDEIGDETALLGRALLGHLARMEGNEEEAARIFGSAAMAASDSPYSWLGRGWAAAREGQAPTASAEFIRTLEHARRWRDEQLARLTLDIVASGVRPGGVPGTAVSGAIWDDTDRALADLRDGLRPALPSTD